MLEYCNGGNLQELMEAKEYKVPGKIIHKIMCQLIDGLNAMMKHNIIHRDLKLENIMIHFPGYTNELLLLDKTLKKKWL